MTQEEQKQFDNAMLGYEQYKRKRALKACFERAAWDYELTDFNYAIRVFCWLKVLICLLLNRTNGSYLSGPSICVLSYDFTQYEYESWDACWINSARLFSGWQVCLASDGT